MKTVLLKISGELLSDDSLAGITDLINQIKSLQKTHRIGVVVGGGNFFRGGRSARAAQLSRGSADLVGMLGTVMNCVILQDLCDQRGVASEILSSISIDNVGRTANQHRINTAFEQNKIIIFAGGSGVPFMTTDTTAVIRALQIGAHELWKATKVEHLYDKDPAVYTDARVIMLCSHEQAINQKLGIMDLTALTMAAEHKLTIRIFKGLAPRSLERAAQENSYGSIIATT